MAFFRLTFFAALIVLFGSPSAISVPTYGAFKGYKDLVVFGDSLSDNGNVFRLSNYTWPIPAYPTHVFSNGAVWNQYIQGVKLHNYAFGSATSDATYIQGLTKNGVLPVPGFIQQIDELFVPQMGSIDLSKTLFAVWFVGNDIIFNNSVDPKIVASNVARGVDNLINLGAKHLVVFRTYDISIMPFSRDLNSTAWIYLTQNFVAEYNRKIDTEISRLQNKHRHAKNHVSLSVFPTDIFWKVLMSKAPSFGVSNEVDPCLITTSTEPVVVESLCPDPSKYYWWDQFHPITDIHKRLARQVEMWVKPLH